MKLKSFRVRNFLSAKDITLTFSESGVFHLYGANNIGKSVLVKSLRALFLNLSNNQYKEFLRDECDTFVIEAETWSGDFIKLSRGASDYYEWTIDGVSGRLDKTGGKIPVVVEKFVNMYTDTEKTKECLNIRLPRSVLPFVDTTAGENYYLLQKALGTEDYILSIKLADKKKRVARDQISTVMDYKVKEDAKLALLDGLVAEERVKLDRIEEYEQVLKAEYEVYTAIEDVVHLAQDVQRSMDEVKRAQGSLQNINLDELRDELSHIKEIESTLSLMVEMVHLNNEIKELKGTVDLYDGDKIRLALEESKVAGETLTLMIDTEEVEKEIAVLTEKVNLYDSVTLRAALEESKAAGETLMLLTDMEEVEDGLTALREKVTSYNGDELRLALSEYKATEETLTNVRELNKAKKQVAESRVTYEESDKELGDFMRENKFCPIVAKTLNKVCPFTEGEGLVG